MNDAATTKLRTFIAIDLPAPLRQALRARQEQLQRDLAAVEPSPLFRWSAVEGIHLTLRFLGDTTPQQGEAVAEVLRALAAQWSPFTLRVGGLGGFPNLRRPRVLWLGVDGEVEALARLQAAVEASAVAAGFAPEPKAFRPHLTLARVRREAPARAVQDAGAALAELAAAQSDAATAETDSPGVKDALTFRVTELIHYRSDLQRGGAVYTPLTVIPLG